MNSKEEPNCLFGGMAIPQWDINYHYLSDPID